MMNATKIIQGTAEHVFNVAASFGSGLALSQKYLSYNQVVLVFLIFIFHQPQNLNG